MKFSDYIIRDSKTLGGVPIIKGTQIPLDVVLGHLAAGDSPEKIVKIHPALTQESLRAVVAFSAAKSQQNPGKHSPDQKPSASKKAKTLQVLSLMLKKDPGNQRVKKALERLEKGASPARRNTQQGLMTAAAADKLISLGHYAQAAKIIAYLSQRDPLNLNLKRKLGTVIKLIKTRGR
ncbi:MAG TPA: DUF433 domain-containing protein [bacterium]